MQSHPIMQIDAFTTQRLRGNPCAVVFEADDLEATTMQAIAREMNLSETAFVLRSTRADFRARYFTPADEIPLAGHPTISTIFALIDSGRLALTGDHMIVTLELKAGVIPVEICAAAGRVQRIVMSQIRPTFLRTHPAVGVLPAFGLESGDLLPGVPIQTVSTGTPQLMIPVRSLDVLRRVRAETAAFMKLHAGGDFFSAHLFCLSGITERGHTFARHFAPPPDIFEDPFTGSATGGMAAYLWHYGLVERPHFVAEQGHWMGRAGEGTVEVVGPRADIEAVKVGGSAVTVLRGELLL